MKYLVLVLVFLAGCGTSRKEWVEKNCSENGAQELGKRDARYNRKTGVIALQQKCPKDKNEMVKIAYEKGFKEVAADLSSEGKQYGQDLLHDVVNVLNDESTPTKKIEKQETSKDAL